jgi:hypothetical protein
MTAPWLVRQTAGDVVHTAPLDDGIVHEFTTECLCGLTVLPVDDGGIVVHHSLDAREGAEQS